MALPIILTTLADRRARYVAEMEYHQARVDAARDAIAKIDAVTDLWDCKPELTEVRRRYRAHPDGFRWREITQTVLNILHAAPDGLTTAEVQYLLAEQKGITGTDERRRLAKRVSAALNDKRRDGTLVQDGKRDGLNVFRIAREGEGVRDQRRVEEYQRRNALRTLERIERARKARTIAG